MNFALVGYGKMGREVSVAAKRRGHRLVAIVDPAARGRLVRRAVKAADLRRADVAFEFSAPECAEANVVALLDAGVAVVCGTTGWDMRGRAVRKAARNARRGAVLAPNFSLGMALFYSIVSRAAKRIASSRGYDAYVHEHHHRRKRDAPSGTALRLAAIVAAADARHPRVVVGWPDGPLEPGAVHVSSIRAGQEPGVHTVGFDGEHDEIVLVHRSRGRSGLAAGAVLAAEWLGRRRGIHTFEEVLADLLGRGEGR